MNTESKSDVINEAIRLQALLSFDYVSKARKISLERLVEPIELIHTEKHGIKLWAKDQKNNNLLKQFDLEGIQEPKVVEREAPKREPFGPPSGYSQK